ncbi:MAG: flagellar motor switch protein FliM [Clostridia bacterium]|nr:flagellar motor switch protein FliM [Clostridia bacterium]
MTEILSQAEIDALLSALSTGETNAEKAKNASQEKSLAIKVYDFKRPNKFSKEQLHTIQAIHESFCRLVTTYFSAHLRTIVQINVVSVEQLTYEEVVGSIPNPTIMNVVTVEPLEGNIILEINPGIAFTIIDRLFGGPGEAPEKMRGLTDIERSVVERVINNILDLLAEAWENIVQFNPKLEVIESNPQFAQIVSPTEMVVMVTLETKIGEREGLMTICIPYIVLEPIISKLTAHFWYSSTSRKATSEHIETLKQRVEKVKVPLIGRLGTATISIGELLELHKGDVIQINKSINEPIEILVGSKIKFYGLPGLAGSRVAIQITGVAREGDDEGDE